MCQTAISSNSCKALSAQVSSPVELEQCDEDTLADILGTEARVAFYPDSA